MNAIVAVDQNWGIGKNNDLLFHIGSDLKRFRSLTLGQNIIMGRKTLESLPGGKGLPKRRNIVLTAQPDFTAENAETVHNPAQLIFAAGADAFVIGGATVYRQLLNLCDRVYVTKVFACPEADAFFPNLDDSPDWEVACESEIMEENGLRFQYVDYVPVAKEDEDDFLTMPAPAEDFAPVDGFSPFSGF